MPSSYTMVPVNTAIVSNVCEPEKFPCIKGINYERRQAHLKRTVTEEGTINKAEAIKKALKYSLKA